MTKKECIKLLKDLIEISEKEYEKAFNENDVEWREYNDGQIDAYKECIDFVKSIEVEI